MEWWDNSPILQLELWTLSWSLDCAWLFFFFSMYMDCDVSLLPDNCICLWHHSVIFGILHIMHRQSNMIQVSPWLALDYHGRCNDSIRLPEDFQLVHGTQTNIDSSTCRWVGNSMQKTRLWNDSDVSISRSISQTESRSGTPIIPAV